MRMNHLEPAPVWHLFEEILRIRRGMDAAPRIAEFIYGEAIEHGLRAEKDEYNNVVVWVPASIGREQEAPVMIRCHLDMLEDLSMTSEHEYEAEGELLSIQDGQMMADGIPIGADDGMGIAMMMALLRDHSIHHPAMELVFISDGNMGTSQTRLLAPEMFKSSRIIHLENTSESVVIRGRSGVMNSWFEMPIQKDILYAGETFKVHVRGLDSGRGSFEDGPERDNAIVILGRLLTEVKSQVTLMSIQASEDFNNVPTEAEAVILTDMPEDTLGKLNRLFKGIMEEKSSLSHAELVIRNERVKGTCYTRESFDRILAAMALMPQGVMSRDPETGKPLYSSNMYMIKAMEKMLIIGSMTCYSTQTVGNSFCDKLNYLSELLHSEVVIKSNVPAWQANGLTGPVEISQQPLMIHGGRVMEVSQSHMASESTLLSAVDERGSVALMPEVRQARSVNESISVQSVQRTYDLVKGLLETRQ